MAFSFLDKQTIPDAWSESQTYMRPLWEPFDEYERIAENKPFPGIAPHLPKVTDGTVSSHVIKQPRRIIQQLPTGTVTCDEDKGFASVSEHIWLNQILPNANTGGSVLQKSWASTTKALTYGSQPAYVFFTQHGDYFGADFRLPYIRDVFLESGQLCAGDSNFIFMRDWYTPSQIQALIEKEKKLQQLAEERGEKYKSHYDLKKLAKLKDMVTQKDKDSQNPDERRRNTNSGGIELIRAFQAGVGAEFYTFAPALDNDIICTKPNKDPRGKIPIVYQYHTVDMNSPLGRGAPEHSGSVQNLVDSMLQTYQYTQALMLSPPRQKWGDGIVMETVKNYPDAIWDMGNDPSSKIETVNVNNQAISDFKNNYGLLKSIIITGSNGSDTSISSEAGSPGFSKTHAGVQQQQAVLGVDDNYIRKQFETWFEELSETMINVHFAENAGREELQVEGDALQKLAAHYPELEENGGNLDVVFANAKAVKLQVDANTSKGDDQNEQVEILSGIISEVTENPILLERAEAEGYEVSIGEALNQKVIDSGVNNPEKIIRKLSEEEIAEKEEAAMQEAMQQTEGQIDEPQEELPPDDQQPPVMPEEMSEGLPQEEVPELTPTQQQIVEALRVKGVDDASINYALDLFEQGASAQQVKEQIGVM